MQRQVISPISNMKSSLLICCLAASAVCVPGIALLRVQARTIRWRKAFGPRSICTLTTCGRFIIFVKKLVHGRPQHAVRACLEVALRPDADLHVGDTANESESCDQGRKCGRKPHAAALRCARGPHRVHIVHCHTRAACTGRACMSQVL